MVSNLRSKKMTPQQAERRVRLLSAFEKALRAAEQDAECRTPEEIKMHTYGMRWLATERGHFIAETDRHDTHLLGFLSLHKLKKGFEENGIRTLGDFLSKPASKIERLCEVHEQKLPFVLKILHMKYIEEPYRVPASQQSWHSVLCGSEMSDVEGEKEEDKTSN